MRVQLSETKKSAADQAAMLTQQRDSYRRQAEKLAADLAALESTADSVGHEQYQPSERLHEIRDRVLAELKLGRQAPGYKIAVKVLNQFIEAIEALGEKRGG